MDRQMAPTSHHETCAFSPSSQLLSFLTKYFVSAFRRSMHQFCSLVILPKRKHVNEPAS
jgi:hypothetical protein